MEFLELQCMLLENEEISSRYVLIMVLKQCKTKQEGRLEFTACLRNKNINICTQMLLSFYFVYGWHTAGKPFSDFNENCGWFDFKLIKSSNDLMLSILYDHHPKRTEEAFKAFGLNSKAKT